MSSELNTVQGSNKAARSKQQKKEKKKFQHMES